VKGDTILVTESLEATLTEQFREAVLGSASEKQPLKTLKTEKP
jgi:hypothetical protein